MVLNPLGGVDSGAAFATNIGLQHGQPLVDYNLNYTNLTNQRNQMQSASANIRTRHPQTKNWSSSLIRRNPFERRRNEAADMMMNIHMYNSNAISHQMLHHHHHQQQQQLQSHHPNQNFQNQIHHAQLGQVATHFIVPQVANPYLAGMQVTPNTGYVSSFQLAQSDRQPSGNSWDPAMSTNVSDALSESTDNSSKQNSTQNR
jgi:hypothetical protein